MTTPENKSRIRALHHEKILLSLKIKQLIHKLSVVMETDGVTLDEGVSHDFQTIMTDESDRVNTKYTEDTFEHIFWNQQQSALSRTGKGKKGVRWHPLMVKWCLYLRHQSNKAYETLRDSGLIALPSQRTLRDYSNAVEAGAGFSSDVDNQLLQAAHLVDSPSYHSLVGILIDEMHIREDLVYDKGSINNHLAQFEQSLSQEDAESNTSFLAKSMVVLMVRGLFTTLKFPFAQFPCSSLTGEKLFYPFWETIFQLERLGFKVKIYTCTYDHICYCIIYCMFYGF